MRLDLQQAKLEHLEEADRAGADPARSPVGALLALRLLRTLDGDTVVLPREVALRIREGRLTPRPVPTHGPVLSGRSRSSTLVDRAAAGAVLALLDDVDLELRAGEIVGLIGPNGSGKTTLINVISGLYVADAGTIVFVGQPIADLPAHAIARLGMALIDGVAVEELAQVSAELGRPVFMLVVAPPRIGGLTGIPVNPLAVF